MPHASVRASMVVNVAGLVLIGFSALPTTAEDFLGGDATQAVLRPRVRVAAHNIEETDIRDCLSNAVEAANSENLDGFVNCFTGSTKSKIRKQAAIRFVQHDVSMELLDTQVLKVSLVAVKQENGYWLINSEKIQSYEHQSPSMCSPSRYACLGGTCRVAARR